MADQNKASLRKKTRSAMSHKRLADEILDSLADSQAKWNAAMAKLDADTAIALDTDYAATLSISDVVEFDGEGSQAQHKRSLRESLRSALSHRKLADELADSLEEMQAAHNAMMAKLDAQAGTLADVDWVATIGLAAIDLDSAGTQAQHQRSFRESFRSAMAHKNAADAILDAVSGLQAAMNASLAQLDLGNVNGAHAGFAVSAIDPDAV